MVMVIMVAMVMSCTLWNVRVKKEEGRGASSGGIFSESNRPDSDAGRVCLYLNLGLDLCERVGVEHRMDLGIYRRCWEGPCGVSG